MFGYGEIGSWISATIPMDRRKIEMTIVSNAQPCASERWPAKKDGNCGVSAA